MSDLPSDEQAQSGPVIRFGDSSEEPLKIGEKYRPADPKVDICFVFDTTGSMTDKIDGLVASTVDLVRDLSTLRLDWQITTVPFGDLTVPGDRVVGDQPAVNTLAAAEAQLRNMPRFSGGGNTGESSLEAIEVALTKRQRAEAVKVLVLITDEPALQNQAHSTKRAEGQLREAEVILFVASPNLPYYKEWAETCGGIWVEIGPVMDTARLREIFRQMAGQIAAVADDVVRLAAGDVGKFLQLPSRPDRRLLGKGSE
jgi:hypothetical protein